MLEQARQHYSTGGYYYATSWLERVLKYYPDTKHRDEVLTLMAKAYAASNREEKAAGALTALIKAYPQAAASLDPELLKLAEYAQQPQPSSGVPSLQQIQKSVPPSPAPAPTAQPVAEVKPEADKANPSRPPFVKGGDVRPALSLGEAEPAVKAESSPSPVPVPAAQPVAVAEVKPVEPIAEKTVSAPLAAPVPAPQPAAEVKPEADKANPPSSPFVKGGDVRPALSPGEPEPVVKVDSSPSPVPAPAAQPVAVAEVKPVEPIAEKTVSAPLSAPVPAPQPVAEVKPEADKANPPSSPFVKGGDVRPEVGTKLATKNADIDANKAGEAGTFTLRFGEYVTKLAMENARRKLAQAGLSPTVEHGEKKKEPMIRLHAGAFLTSDAAKKEQDKLRAANIDSFILKEGDRKFHIYAGSYAEQQRAEKELHRLVSLGLKPTLKKVIVSVPTFQLAAGSFATRESAEKSASELEKQGLKSRVSFRPHVQ